MAKKGRKRSYDAYKREYRSKERKLNANGVSMNQRMLTEAEFNAQYDRILNQRKKDVASGKRKTTGNITRDLVDRQAFTLTAKQAEAMITGKKTGNYYQRRSGASIEEREAELVEKYLENHPDREIDDALRYARGEISTEFFGS